LSSVVVRDLFSNAAAQAWAALLTLVFVPVYLRLLGTEAYGVIAFFTALQAAFAFLDLGLSATATREFATQRDRPHEPSSAFLLVTLERVYGGIGVAIALGIAALSHWIATEWLNAPGLNPTSVTIATLAFGLSVAVRWPTALYAGVLRGQGRHLALNTAQISIATIRHVGAATALVTVSPSVTTFTLWQAIAACVELGWLRMAAWLPVRRVHPDLSSAHDVLRRVWRFSAAVTLASTLATILKQADKLVLSGAVPVREMAYYGVASMLATTVFIVVVPFQNTALPVLTKLWHDGDQIALAAAFHRYAQLVAFVASPVASVLVFFAPDLLWVWTRAPDVAENAAKVLVLLGLAGMLNTMMHMPYALQLACGLTGVAIWNNAVSVLLFVPVSIWSIGRLGIVGPALTWCVFNVGYYSITPIFIHRRVLRGHLWNWRLNDTLPFMVGSLTLAGCVRAIQLHSDAPYAFVLAAVAAAAFYIAVCATCCHAVRTLLGYDWLATETG
jgi:O-antigen/teichoic acid export membrane protein